MKHEIGTKLIDRHGNIGIVQIRWNDGDVCITENDAAHPEPDYAVSTCDGCQKDFRFSDGMIVRTDPVQLLCPQCWEKVKP